MTGTRALQDDASSRDVRTRAGRSTPESITCRSTAEVATELSVALLAACAVTCNAGRVAPLGAQEKCHARAAS